MMRSDRLLPLWIGAVALLAMAAPAAGQAAAPVERDTYRYGATFDRVATGTPDECRRLCADQARCEAWSHMPRQVGVEAMCELKAAHGRAEHRPGYMSGLAGLYAPGVAQLPADSAGREADSAAVPGGLRQRTTVFPETYRAVSAGVDVDELLGAGHPSRPAMPPPPASRPQPQPAVTVQPSYAPTRIQASGPRVGRLVGSPTAGAASTSSASPAPGPSTVSSRPSHGSTQIIRAEPTTEPIDEDFYTDE